VQRLLTVRVIMTIVRPSKLQRDGLFGALIAVFVLAMVRGLTGAASGGGRIAVVVFTGAGGGRYRRSALTIAGSRTVLPLSFVSLAEIQRKCVASGWRFTRPGRRAVR